jgi:hypothetical protein
MRTDLGWLTCCRYATHSVKSPIEAQAATAHHGSFVSLISECNLVRQLGGKRFCAMAVTPVESFQGAAQGDSGDWQPVAICAAETLRRLSPPATQSRPSQTRPIGNKNSENDK